MLELEDGIAACTGLISLTSGKQAKNKGMPRSTAAITFWGPIEALVKLDDSKPPIDPLVLRTRGSFPKAEQITSFTWAPVDSGVVLQKVTLTYKTKGWNPVSVLSEK